MSEAMIYVISKTKHGDMWRGYQREGVPIISSWLHFGAYRFRESDFRPRFWERAFYQLTICTAVIAYRLPDENWDHAWPELFFARHLSKPIYSVGLKDTHFGRPWLAHCKDIVEAIGRASVVPDDPKYPGRAKGGRARAANLSAERRSEIAREAAKTRWRASA